MKIGRFFVTSVFILATAAFVACTSKSDKRSAQVTEGNQQLQVAASAQTSLESQFKISLNDTKKTFDWNSISRTARQSAKEKLADYVSAVTRTLAIDAKKGLYLTQKELVQQQLAQAMVLQKSLETFESTYGETFDPKVESKLEIKKAKKVASN